MYASLRGTLTYLSPISATVEVQGLGYKLFYPASIYAALPAIGTEVLFHTSFVVRESLQAMYGFLSIEERDLFEILIAVSGIGPKTALSIIGHLAMHDLHTAISRNDISAICKVPGIGKKTAERLIIEVKDKLHHFIPAHMADAAVPMPKDPQAQMINDAMNALINLGYYQVTAQKAIKKSMKDSDLGKEDLGALITLALKHV